MGVTTLEIFISVFKIREKEKNTNFSVCYYNDNATINRTGCVSATESGNKAKIEFENEIR